MSKGLLDPKVDFVDYSKLDRTVCINILNFKYLKTNKFHTGYRLKEIESNEDLTDIIEMHFIEITKSEDDSDEKDMLVAWTEFLKNPESEKVRNLEMSVKEIREAKDELIKMSNDSKQREIYDMRAKILKDKVSSLNKAKEEGRENKAIKVAENLLKMGLNVEQIVIAAELPMEKVIEIKNKFIKSEK